MGRSPTSAQTTLPGTPTAGRQPQVLLIIATMNIPRPLSASTPTSLRTGGRASRSQTDTRTASQSFSSVSSKVCDVFREVRIETCVSSPSS